MRLINKELLADILIVIVLTLFLLFNAFFITIFNSKIYDKQFEKLGVAEQFPQNNVSEINKDLLRYLFGKELGSKDFFNEIEILHLKDVRNIFRSLKIVYIVFSVLLLPLIYFASSDRKRLYYCIKNSWLGTCFIALGLFAISSFFEKMFIKMHELIFFNDYWQLDPATSNLINMYPLEIFIYLFFRIIVTWLIMTSTLYVMVLIMRKMYNIGRIKNNY
jgi:integral membrane protein (TIGR01906 family)